MWLATKKTSVSTCSEKVARHQLSRGGAVPGLARPRLRTQQQDMAASNIGQPGLNAW